MKVLPLVLKMCHPWVSIPLHVPVLLQFKLFIFVISTILLPPLLLQYILNMRKYLEKEKVTIFISLYFIDILVPSQLVD